MYNFYHATYGKFSGDIGVQFRNGHRIYVATQISAIRNFGPDVNTDYVYLKSFRRIDRSISLKSTSRKSRRDKWIHMIGKKSIYKRKQLKNVKEKMSFL